MNAEEVFREIVANACAADCQDKTDIERHVEQAVAEFKQRVEQPLDGKFSGWVWRNRDGKIETEFVVFVPRDRWLPLVLVGYERQCRAGGAGTEQIASVQRLLDRVTAWQEAHPDQIKTPDAEPGECK